MTEPPLTAHPQPPLFHGSPEPPLVGAKPAGIALLAAGLLICCLMLAMVLASAHPREVAARAS